MTVLSSGWPTYIYIEAWEARHYPLDLPDPIEAIKHHMAQRFP